MTRDNPRQGGVALLDLGHLLPYTSPGTTGNKSLDFENRDSSRETQKTSRFRVGKVLASLRLGSRLLLLLLLRTERPAPGSAGAGLSRWDSLGNSRGFELGSSACWLLDPPRAGHSQFSSCS